MTKKRFSLVALVVCLSGGSIPPLVFSESASQLEPIVVSRDLGKEGESAAAGVVSISSEQIEKLPVSTPEDVLPYLGVNVQSRGSLSVKSDLSLNGSTFQQVLVLVNGARVKDAQTSHHDLDLFFNLEDIERIEILPPSASLRYGPDALAGAVNFVLKRGRSADNTFTAAAGSYDSHRESLSVGYGNAAWENRFSVAEEASDGSRPYTDARSNTFFHSATWQGEGASFFMDAGYNEKEFGAYDFYTPGRGYPSREWVNTTFVQAQGQAQLSDVVIEPRLSWRRHHDKFMLKETNPSLYLNHHRTDTSLGGVRLSKSFESVALSAGVDVADERIVSSNLGNHDRGRWDIYFDPTWTVTPQTTLSTAVRLDSDTSFGEDWSAGLSAAHRLSDRDTVFLTVGRSIRIPTFTELYYNDPTTQGDDNLQPEHAVTAEIGWRLEPVSDLSGSVSFFTRWEQDTIDYVKQSPADAKFVASNISEAFTQGVKMMGGWRLSDVWGLDGQYTYANKRPDDKGYIYKYGLNVTRHQVGVGLDFHQGGWHARADLMTTKKMVRRAWTLLDVRLSREWASGWSVFTQANNLTNTEYQDIEGIPVQGRVFMLGMEVKW